MLRPLLSTLFVLSILAAGCSSGRLSDGDAVRFCRLTSRCTGVSQDSCEINLRVARDSANAEGCGPQFGAAARCQISADLCEVPFECFDESERLQTCQGGGPVDSGLRVDGGGFPPIDSGGTITRSDIRLGALDAIEIYHEGQWRPICDDGFGTEEANVACRHLGFSGAASFTTVTGSTDEFWLDDVTCSGSESWIDQCSHGGWGYDNCSASETQAVTCF